MKHMYIKMKAQRLLKEGRNAEEIARILDVSIVKVKVWEKEWKRLDTRHDNELQKVIAEKKQIIDRLRRDKDFKEAEKEVRELLDLVPDDLKLLGRLMQILVELAKLEVDETLRRQKLADVEKIAEEILKKDPRNIMTMISLLEVYKVYGKGAKVRELEMQLRNFETELFELIDNFEEARSDLIRIYEETRTKEELIELLEKMRGNYPNCLICRVYLVRIRNGENDVNRECKLQEEILEIQPDNLKALNRLIRIYSIRRNVNQNSQEETLKFKMDLRRKIMNLRRKVIELNAKDINNRRGFLEDAERFKGEMFEVSAEELQTINEAVVRIGEELLNLDGENIKDYFVLYRAYMEQGKLREAEAVISKVANPQNTNEGVAKALKNIEVAKLILKKKGINLDISEDDLSVEQKKEIIVISKTIIMNEYGNLKNPEMVRMLAEEIMKIDSNYSFAKTVSILLDAIPDDLKACEQLLQTLTELVKNPDLNEEKRSKILNEIENSSNEILKKDPKNIQAMLSLLEVYRIQGKDVQLGEIETRLHNHEKELVGIVNNLGEDCEKARWDLIRIYEGLGKKNELIELLEKMRIDNAYDLACRIYLIRIRKEEKNMDEEGKLQEEVLKIQPNNKTALNRLLVIYSNRKNIVQSSQEETLKVRTGLRIKIMHLRKRIIELNPDNIESRREFLEDGERFKGEMIDVSDEELESINEDMRRIGEELLYLDKRNVKNYIILYRVYMEQGKLRAAEAVISKVAGQKYTNEDVSRALKNIELAKLLLNKKGIDIKVPEDDLNEECKNQITSVAQTMLMDEYNRLKNLRMVMKLARQIIKKDPDNPYAKAVEEYNYRMNESFISDTLSTKTSYGSHIEYDGDELDDDELNDDEWIH